MLLLLATFPIQMELPDNLLKLIECFIDILIKMLEFVVFWKFANRLKND